MTSKNQLDRTDKIIGVSTLIIWSLICYALGLIYPLIDEGQRYQACIVTNSENNCDCWIKRICPTNYSPGKINNNE